MNISEALKLLQDGKKIYHESAPYIIYQLIDKQLKIYRKYDTDDYYCLFAVSRNEIYIDCENNLEDWEEKIEPIAMTFYIAMEFYKAGKQIRRIGEKEWFSKYDLYPMSVTVDDIEANDWEVME